MEATRRERIFLYGVIPVASVIIGAIVTVVLQRLFGADSSGDALALIAADQQMSPQAKLLAMRLVNENAAQFYEFLRNAISSFMIPTTMLGAMAIMNYNWKR